MSVPMRMLRLTAVAPVVLGSTLLTLMVLALLPALVGSTGFVVGVVVLAVLSAGLLEAPLIQTLTGARELTESETAALLPVLARLAATKILVGDLHLHAVPGSSQPAAVRGRRSLLVSTWLVEAAHGGQLSRDEAAALIAHAIGRHTARPHRFELVLWVWSAPCCGVIAVAGWVGAVAGWFPLVRPAWRLRCIVATVCVVQQASEGRTVYGLIAGSFIAFTYLVPAAKYAVERRIESAADTLVVDHGLGPALTGVLQRAGERIPTDRLRRLDTSTSPAADDPVARRPALYLLNDTAPAPAS